MYQHPTNMELRYIREKLIADLTMNDPIFQILPMDTTPAAVLTWEQENDSTGLMQVRGIGGAPRSVQQLGAKRFVMTPGYYGEKIPIDEQQMLLTRQLGTFGQPVNLDELVIKNTERLVHRRLARIKAVGWSLLSTGRFAIGTGEDGTGPIQHTDQFSVQTFTAGTAWSTTATATPLANLRAARLYGRGYSVSFGRDARLYMNIGTLNNMLNNSNAADIGGKRVSGGNSINSESDINRILLDNDLPQIVVTEGGYYDSTGTWNLYVPDSKAVLVGRRLDGGQIGNFMLTANVQNPNFAPGFYDMVVDNGDRAVPRVVEVHGGFNGGPILKYPEAVITMNV